MDPNAVLALCHEHAGAEAELDMDRVLATLVPVARFEFFPMARYGAGWDRIERFYREQYPAFAPTVTGYQMLGEWTNERAALQEYVIEVGGPSKWPGTYHVMSDESTFGRSGEGSSGHGAG